MARHKRKKAREKKQRDQIERVNGAVTEAGAKQAQLVDSTPDSDRREPYARKMEAVHLQRKGTEEDTDPFQAFYADGRVLEPPIPFATLREIRESCDVLTPCRKAYLDNIYRPYDFDYAGDDAEKESPEVKARLQSIKKVLKRVNSRESLLKVMKRMGGDKFDYGNGFIEVMRNRKAEARWFFYCSATYVRLTKLDAKPTKRTVVLDETRTTAEIDYYFRRFVRIDPITQEAVYFKEFGDLRILNKKTGDYLQKGQTIPESEMATEMWFFRNDAGGSPYGLPDWWPGIVDSKGRYTTRWINFDTVDSGGVPPVGFVFKGGQPAQGTREEFEKTLESWRDPSVWNAPFFMTVDSNSMIDPASGMSKSNADIQVIKMRDDRAEEYMFPGYRKEAKDSIRQTLRLPPLYIGASEDNTEASIYASIQIGEALFEPFRSDNDEQVNIDLIQNELKIFDWQVRTMGSRIGDKETYYKATAAMARTGGPSMNHLIDFGNEMFGSQMSRYSDPILNALPAVVVLKMITAGMLTIEGADTNEPRLKVVEQPDGSSGVDMPAALKSAESPVMQLLEQVDNRLQASGDALDLAAVLGRIRQKEMIEYQPPAHTEDDYTQ